MEKKKPGLDARKGWGGDVDTLDLNNPQTFVASLKDILHELEPGFKALGVFNAEGDVIDENTLAYMIRSTLGIDALDQNKVNQWLAVLPIVLDKDNDPQAATCPPNVDSALFKRLLAITHLLRTADSHPLERLRTDLNIAMTEVITHETKLNAVTTDLTDAQNYIKALKQVFPTLAPCGPKKIIKPNLVVAHKGWR